LKIFGSRGEHVSIAAIILAAGRSRRMGTQKLLLPWHGKMVIQQVVGEALAANLNPVVVVTGGDSAEDTAAIQQALNALPVIIANNPDRDAEMLSSVRCGLKVLPRECTAALITPGDLPAISSALIKQLTQAIEQTNRGIVVPIYQGTRGHPTIIAAKYFEEVLTQYNGVGLRGLMAAHPHDIHEVVISDPAVIAEMNTPADYQRQLELDRARRTSEREISD
jgi:molybdenum cofactor cytidylyltransferase